MLDFYDQLRSQIPVSSIVGKKVKLKHTGKEFQGLCPFHNEKSPSFTVSDQKGFYHCFGCQAHGDVIKFVSVTENLSYKEAALKLAQDHNIPVPKRQNAQNIAAIDRDQKNLLILEKICVQFEQNLPGAKSALLYLRNRGIIDAAIKEFRIGFALDSYNILTDFLASYELSRDEMLETGAVVERENNKIYDKFRNRIIFPITDERNRVIAFGGRVLGEGIPKYLNSPETKIFKKGKTLYNFARARSAIFDEGYAVLVEGYMDVISLAVGGIKNVVAGLGTAITVDQLQKLFSITDRIVVCLDSDSAGIMAAKRVAQTVLPLINASKNLEFAFLSNQQDPDDFIREFGSDELRKVFAKAMPLSQALYNFALIEFDAADKPKLGAELKAKIEADLNHKLELITDFVTKKHFSLFFKSELSPFNSKFNSKTSGLKKPLLQKPKSAANVANALALEVITLLLKFPVLLNYSDSLDSVSIREIHFVNPELTELKDLLIELIDEERFDNDSELPKNLLAELVRLALEKSPNNKNIHDYVNVLTVSVNELIDLEFAKLKVEILLLKELAFRVEQQYKELVARIEEIETDQSEIKTQKIKEIVTYRNALEQRITLLERQFI